jgi:hypothetical protein
VQHHVEFHKRFKVRNCFKLTKTQNEVSILSYTQVKLRLNNIYIYIYLFIYIFEAQRNISPKDSGLLALIMILFVNVDVFFQITERYCLVDSYQYGEKEHGLLFAYTFEMDCHLTSHGGM